MKNRYEEVAKMFGLELDEEFIINGYGFFKNPYRFEYDGLLDNEDNTCNELLHELLMGEARIEIGGILKLKEKIYLETVLYPFRDRVKYIIKKMMPFNKEQYFIYVRLDENDKISFPSFEKDEMYKRMELDATYNLRDLGLFKDEKE